MYGIAQNLKSLPSVPPSKSEGMGIKLSLVEEASRPQQTTDTHYMSPSALAPSLFGYDDAPYSGKGKKEKKSGPVASDIYANVNAGMDLYAMQASPSSSSSKMAVVPEDIYDIYERVVVEEQKARRTSVLKPNRVMVFLSLSLSLSIYLSRSLSLLSLSLLLCLSISLTEYALHNTIHITTPTHAQDTCSTKLFIFLGNRKHGLRDGHHRHHEVGEHSAEASHLLFKLR